jgi:hypothetical protein
LRDCQQPPPFPLSPHLAPGYQRKRYADSSSAIRIRRTEQKLSDAGRPIEEKAKERQERQEKQKSVERWLNDEEGHLGKFPGM